MNKYVKKSLKVTAWIVGSIVGLFLLIVIAVQIPFVQNILKNKAVTYLEGKLKTPVKIGHIEIGLPKKVILEDFYFEDQQKDTLLAGSKIAVDISLFKLFSNEVEINSVDLIGITANVTRDKDSVFNFDYIIKAFSTNPKPKDTTSQPMKISLEKINLEKIRVKFVDAVSRNDLKVYINKFETNIDKFDLDNLDFAVPKIKLDGLDLKLKQGKLVQEIAVKTGKVADSLAQSPNLKLKLGTIDLANIKISYGSGGNNLDTGLSLEKLLLRINALDLREQVADIESLDIKNLKGGFKITEFEKKLAKDVDKAAVAPQSAPGKPWIVKLNQADLKGIDFKFNDENAVADKNGIDYKHLDIKNLNLVGEKFVYRPDQISGNIYAFTVQEQSGLDIQSLKTKFYYGDKKAYLKELYLKTPQTLLKDKIEIGYQSMDALTNDIANIQVNADLNGSRIGFKDILIFVPTLSGTDPFKSNPNAIVDIDSRITGKVSDLQIPKLRLSGIGNTIISANGSITGLPDAKNAYFDLRITELRSTSTDIMNFVPPGTLPSSIQLPSQLGVTGFFTGYINNFRTDLDIATSFGGAKVKATFDQTRKNAEKYTADAQLSNFDIGKLIKNDSLGKVTMRAKVKGVGLNPKTANATIEGKVSSLRYNSYTYKDLDLYGKIKGGLYDVKASIDQPDLAFVLESNGSFRGKYPQLKLNLNLDIADLDKLNLHAGPMKIRGIIDADIATADPDYLNGKIFINELMIGNKNGEYAIDTVSVIAKSTADSTSIVLRSPLIDANANGSFKLTQITGAVTNSIAKYYGEQSRTSKKVPAQQIAFDVNVKNSPLILKLVPEIKALEPITASGRYNSVNDSIVFKAIVPKLVYGSIDLTNAAVDINTEKNQLNYNVVVDNIENGSIKLPYTQVAGKVENNVVDYTLLLKDAEGKERYYVSGKLESTKAGTEISLDPDKLKLNYQSWNVDGNNVIKIGDSGIYAKAFELSKAGNSLKIQSQSAAPNAPLEVKLTNFEIETLSGIVQKDSLLVGGSINGSALIKNLSTSPTFIADLDIQNFSFKTDTVGNIKIKVDNNIANVYDAKVAITGKGNQVNLDGVYKANGGTFDMVLDMQHLEIKSIQGFTMGNIKNSSGFLSGKFKITGTADGPNVLGDLKFNDGAFTVTPLNSAFKLLNDKISLNSKGILFEKFSLTDENDNVLSVKGNIDTQNYRDYAFNLNIDADNFRAINSTEKDNDLYYGTLFMDTKLRVRGNLDQPIIDGTIKINEDTDLTVVLPQSDPSIADREGIVEFVDFDKPGLKKVEVDNEAISQSQFKGMDVNVNIEVVKEATLSLIIDKGNGDYLKLKGEARLTGGIDPSGKTSLTGRYEFTEGAYEMTFNLLKRKFEIKPGSFILWTGEPTTANVSITAVYKTEAAPIDLLDSQLAGVSDRERNTYKQQIPFETNLIMKGELLKPEITFDIVLPEGNNSVSTQIINNTRAKLAQLRQQPSELNKQVFALLLLNRFIGENPFSSEAGSGSAENLARQSASKILSQQLNNLASDLITGVELNFDLDSQEDYTSGTKRNRTDLNVGVSKTLLDDRLKVTVGSTFGLEGSQQAGQETNTIAGDVSVDYQLSKDGKYRIRAYRKNRYQVALQGQVIETGIAFIITLDYNKFKELFEKSKVEDEPKPKKKDTNKNTKKKK